MSASDPNQLSPLDELSYAYGKPENRAILRQLPEDFQVTEELGFALEGSGEHVYLQIQKRQLNTEDIVKQLAQRAQVNITAVSYAGLKDRNAVTSQWFSVHLPGTGEPDWGRLETDNITILSTCRHRQKLRRGKLKANHFILTLREVTGARDVIEQCLNTIKAQGTPNYFGQQRFGRDGANITRARDMFAGNKKIKNRHLRGLYLSAARSWLFNLVLSRRVQLANWNKALLGDAMILNGTNRFFLPDKIDTDIERRVEEMDVHASGPLWGSGKVLVTGDVEKMELEILNEEPLLLTGLEKMKLDQERRALRLIVPDLQWCWLESQVLKLEFSLPRGTYATSVLRECFICKEAGSS